MTWMVVHRRTRATVVVNVDALLLLADRERDLSAAVDPDRTTGIGLSLAHVEVVTLRGRHFEIACPLPHEGWATHLLIRLDDWAEDIGLDDPGGYGPFAHWTAIDVSVVLRGHLLRHLRAVATALPYPDPRVIHQTPLWSREAASHESCLVADRQAAAALDRDEPRECLTWGQVNRAVCRWVHRDRERIEERT